MDISQWTFGQILEFALMSNTAALIYGPLFAVDGPKVSHEPSSLLTNRFCGWQSVRLARTVVLVYGPNTERAYHYHIRVNCSWRSVRFTRTVILAYGPSFVVDGPYVSHWPIHGPYVASLFSLQHNYRIQGHFWRHLGLVAPLARQWRKRTRNELFECWVSGVYMWWLVLIFWLGSEWKFAVTTNARNVSLGIS